ncbi:glycosyltransferase family 25 protein [Psychrobacter sp. DAB_AL62B]|uniref:glycosyltransferase family 25 protein n=1 Tax=Psychrobacter sp. DAB_AL62B TaxID=1028420 RepID=UPI00238121AC|nr:glycosyltransferase family 25 protein [Psychrobacter sp. DAB_AL62B]MDE4453839.1 glycosyl transferase [Psychrobacter sp. DAB_AL62B]
MKNIVISLKTATDRRHHIEQEFQKNHVEFGFFDALTPDAAKSYAKKLSINFEESDLTGGELACLMSHVSIWKKMIDEGIPYLAVFEDDVYLGEDAEYLLNTIDWIKPEWNIIKTETVNDKIILSSDKHAVIAGKRYIAQLKSIHLGSGSYILSLRGAKLYFDYFTKNKLIPIDELMFDAFLCEHLEPVYQMTPALCIQEIILRGANSELLLPGSLMTDRSNKVNKTKKSFTYKLKREANRLASHVRKAISAEDIPFK